jgi:hypothetical protein
MTIEYRVYDPQKGEFLGFNWTNQAEAIADADEIASQDQFQGRLEVHEITDGNLATARRVYETRG